MQRNTFSAVCSWLLILLWPFIATFVLFALVLIRPDQTFISELNLAFFIVSAIIVASHIVAFCMIPLLTLWLFKPSKGQFFALKIVGVFVVFLQTFFRAIANTFFLPTTNHPYVMTTTLDNIVTATTLLVLACTYIIILYILRPKDHRKS